MKDGAYKEAGVDIEATAELIDRIKPRVSRTERSGVMSGLGGFGALFDLKETGYQDPVLVSATDGVGTKIKVAVELDRHDTIGIDAVAMCVNDIIVQGAEPLFFLDYFATGKLVNEVAEQVIGGIAEGCEQAGCALIGGETAEMPGLYLPGDYDIAGFCVGAVERSRLITGERVSTGDVIIGLPSNGLHSNGFSLIRKIFKEDPNLTFESHAPFVPELTLGELILMPTRIYVKSVLKALSLQDEQGEPCVKTMANITGGGLVENIPRTVPDHLSVHLDATEWTLPPLFHWVKQTGRLSAFDMANTLNCGIGFVLIAAPDAAPDIMGALQEAGESPMTIGEIRPREVNADSVEIHNIDQVWE